jgi:beta-N-acetylhexosaminidase
MPQTDASRAVGKLITGKINGFVLDAECERQLSAGTMSGVTLFKDNVRDLNQLFDLITQTRAAAGGDVIIAVDQEGGAVQRFDDVLSPIPSAMALAALDHTGRVHDVMNICAQQLHLLGVNCNLTPVLDVNSNPRNPIIGTRSFGDNTDQIIRLSEMVAKAHKANHVLAVGKHFPGHGDTAEDSHLKLAVDRADEKTLQERELKPFAECATTLPAMLVGHVWLPAYDENPLPASLSRRVTTGILREQMNFDGYVFTDDMPVMKAIVDHWGLEDACVMAINAGADNVLVSGTAEQISSVHRALLAAVDSGNISQQRLAQSIQRRERVLSLTTGSLEYRGEARQALASSVESSKHHVLQASIAAICTIRGQVPHLVGALDNWIIVAPDHPRYSLKLAEFVAAKTGAKIVTKRFPLDPGAEEVEELANDALGKNCILLTFRALLNPGQLRLAEGLAQVCSERTVIAVDVPYELAHMPAWSNALATFDPSDLAMEALATVLTEGIKTRGRCPVRLT